MENLISVIMPVYNAERFLRESVESVLHQSYQNWELLLVDDCSTDRSLQIAKELAAGDDRVHVIQMASNSGVASTRNRGIRLARGAYIALLDSDDVWTPEKLERQLRLLKETGAQIGYSSYDFIDENSRDLQKPFLVPPTTDYRKMLTRNVISCSTILVESTLLKTNPFKSDYYHEDYVLWMELLADAEIKAAGETAVLTHYRRVSGSRSDDKRNAARERWRIYREAFHMDLLSSLAAFLRYAVNGVKKYYF